ncbi:MAG: MerR family transcriptional regulator [Anaerolineae bacterium]|nr:MerR family transcriptional regulator [Anaerolineae bacterium]
MTIGEVAQYFGLQTSTLRYYESIGLLPPPRRVSGQRRYTTEVLPVLAVIQLAKDANCSLDEIRTLLYGPSEHVLPSARWRTLVGTKLREVEATIRQALELKALLDEALHCEALLRELDECPLIDTQEPEMRKTG